MFLVNQKNEQIEIDGLMLTFTPAEIVILCKGSMLDDTFITEKLTAIFGHESETAYSGEPLIVLVSSVLSDDQFILKLTNVETKNG